MRVCILFALALMACAMSLVTSQHRARKAFIEIESAQFQSRQLDTEWDQLQVELSAHAKHGFIDQVARNELHMRPVLPAKTVYVQPSAAQTPRVSAATQTGGAQ